MSMNENETQLVPENPNAVGECFWCVTCGDIPVARLGLACDGCLGKLVPRYDYLTRLAKGLSYGRKTS